MHYKYTAKDVARFWGKVQKGNSNDCWLWTGALSHNGYGLISWGGRGKHKNQRAHRIAYQIFFEKSPSGFQVLHKCDNRKCCNPHHLFLGTSKDNTDDMMKKGRYKGNKLTLKQISEIRHRYAWRGIGGESTRKLAKEFGVSSVQISHIVTHKQWKNVS
jgi:hypothetical protein